MCTAIFSYIRMLGHFWGVQIFEFKYIGVITNWTIFMGHIYTFWGCFLSSRYKMGIFRGSLKFHIFLGGGGGGGGVVCLIFFFFW